MNRTRFGLLDTIESIPLETKKRLKKKYNNDEQGGNDKKYVETTYSELKSLRDEGKLIPGALYRITDYQCTTAQENTRSAGHQFDIIVQALSESVLSEDAKAIHHKYENKFISIKYDNETNPYVDSKYITFNDNIKLLVHRFFEDVNNQYWVSDKDLEHCLTGVGASEYEEVGNELITFYNSSDLTADSCTVKYSDYFHSCNLAAWKLKYCLDNDEERFAWAKNLYLSPDTYNKCIIVDSENNYIYVRQPQLDNENGLAWAFEGNSGDLSIKEYFNNGNENLDLSDIIYTQSENVYVGQILDMDGTPVTVVDFSEEGKGVIYQMIDEYNNDCPYDFKNIQFLRTDNWFDNIGYDFGPDVIGNTNFDKYYYTFTWMDAKYNITDASMVYPYLQNDDYEPIGVYNNTIKNCKVWDGSSTNIRPSTLNNIVIISSYNATDEHTFNGIINNTFEEGCYFITCGNKFLNNTIKKDCSNVIMQNDCIRNTIDSGCSDVYIHNMFMNCVFDYSLSGNEVMGLSTDGPTTGCIIFENSEREVSIKYIFEAFSNS